MTASEKILAFIRNSFDTALYFAVMAVKENFRNYVGRAGTVGEPKPSAVILGTALRCRRPAAADRRREHLTKDVWR